MRTVTLLYINSLLSESVTDADFGILFRLKPEHFTLADTRRFYSEIQIEIEKIGVHVLPISTKRGLLNERFSLTGNALDLT